MSAFYDFSLGALNGQPLDLGRFRGQVVLVVNVASRCGFTPQYVGLEHLQQTYGARGFSVLGCPCDQFGHQEPGSAEEIAEFCRLNYGVSFPLSEKLEVNGPGAHPLYQWLKQARGGEEIKWNFTKFLLDRQGRVVGRYDSRVTPEALEADLVALL